MFPLHLAALNAHADCCRKLLSSGEPAPSRRTSPAKPVCRYSKAITFILNITVKNRYVQIRDILVSRHSSVSERRLSPGLFFWLPVANSSLKQSHSPPDKFKSRCCRNKTRPLW